MVSQIESQRGQILGSVPETSEIKVSWSGQIVNVGPDTDVSRPSNELRIHAVPTECIKEERK